MASVHPLKTSFPDMAISRERTNSIWCGRLSPKSDASKYGISGNRLDGLQNPMKCLQFFSETETFCLPASPTGNIQALFRKDTMETQRKKPGLTLISTLVLAQ